MKCIAIIVECKHFEENLLKWNQIAYEYDGGITVSMAAFQDVDPGSAPGHRNPLLNKCVFLFNTG